MAKKVEKKVEGTESKLVTPQNILGFAVILLILVGSYLMAQNSEPLEAENSDEIESILLEVDSLSDGAFNYLNRHRISEGVPTLDLSHDVYLIALDMSKEKEKDNLMFRQAPERNEFVAGKMGLSSASVQYTAIYEIGDLGIEEFENEFDRIYFIKNIVKLEKYNHGAIGCSGSYCSLIVLGDEEIELRKDF
jgi:hypothetical protein